MAIITSPTPDINSNQSTNEKIEMLLNNYYLLRKEIEYTLQNVGFSNLGNDLSQKLKTVDKELGKIDEVVDVDGNLMAAKIAGIINTAVAMVQNSTGQVKFDDRGFIVHDQATEALSTKALLVSSGGILIANIKDVNGDWVWKTAITGDSINASAITAGILTAITINGVTITGSDITSEDANSQIRLYNGVLSIMKKLTSQQFNMNYRDGLPAGVTQTELEYYNEFKATNPDKPAENTISLNSANSHMGLEFGNGAVSVGNDWVKIAMYGGTFDWAKEHSTWISNPDYNDPPSNAVGSKIIIDCATTAWDVVTAYPGLLVAYSSSMDVNVGNVNFAGNVEVSGNFSVNGTKDCVIITENYGKLHFGAYETPEYYFGDIGESEVIDGECVINLDKKLLACINADLPYQVFLQAYGDGRVYVSQRNATNFIVKGDNIKFAWEIKAKRKGYENIRFGVENVI